MLPVCKYEDEILAHLAQAGRLILTAPTGSGKSTQVPRILMQSLQVEGRVICVQPRRVAARFLAKRVASECGAELGEQVGYAVRQDSRYNKRTELLFVTEGVLLKIFQENPSLDGIGAIVLDEFHERNWQTDLLVSLLKRLQLKRSDFSLVVMSATLELKKLEAYLEAPTIEVTCRNYPVNIFYKSFTVDVPVWQRAAGVCKEALQGEESGTVLIFMPGAFEIRKTIEQLRKFLRADEVFSLYGEMSPKDQDEALAPSDGRKVIVCTNIAETSLTVPNVKCVIDSGLARVKRYDLSRGIETLLIEDIAVSSSDQRAGRAGREREGHCYRLWSKSQHERRALATEAELRRIDLSEFLLQAQVLWGDDFSSYDWFERPKEEALEESFSLLKNLDALTAEGQLTEHGRTMASLPLSTRQARFLVAASESGCSELAALVAALISERSILTKQAKLKDFLGSGSGSDFEALMNAFFQVLQRKFDIDFCRKNGLHAQACREVARTWRQIMDLLQKRQLFTQYGQGEEDEEALEKSLMAAYGDRISVRRDRSSKICLLQNGRRAEISEKSVVGQGRIVLSVEMLELARAGKATTYLNMNTTISMDLMEELFLDELDEREDLRFNTNERCVEQKRQLTFRDLVLAEELIKDVDKGRAAEVLAQEVFADNLKLKTWDSKVDKWIEKVRYVASIFPEKDLPVYSDEDRLIILQEICDGAMRYKEIKDRNCLDYVMNALSWDEQQFVKEMAPDRLKLPSGRFMKLSYEEGRSIKGRAFIADLFGLEKTPSLCQGRVSVLLEILAPNHRPIQLTEDLESFWRDLYPELKKVLSRRYPKHRWD